MNLETTAYIKAFLDSLNIKYDCPLETGVIAYLEGNGSHTIAYRADIDALPILERKMMCLIAVDLIM